MTAYNFENDDLIENAVNRVVLVRRMKKNGTLEWHNPETFGQ